MSSSNGVDVATAQIDTPAPTAAPSTGRKDGESAPDASVAVNPMTLINGRVGGAVLAVLSFWVLALLIPDAATAVPAVTIWGVDAALLLVGFVTATLILVWTRTHARSAGTVAEFSGGVSLALMFMLIAALWTVTADKLVPVTPDLRFGIGVGGSSLAALAIGLLLFRSLRAAATLPIVVLFIGVAAFPAGQQLTGNLGGTLIGWMAGIIGAAAVAESAGQIAETIQRGHIAREALTAPGLPDGDAVRAVQDAAFPDVKPRPASS